MKKKTIIISGIAAVLVIGSVVFCFAVKGDGTQPAEVAQTVTEAVATPSIEATQETSEEVSIVEVAETTEENEDAGVPTQKEEVSSEQVAEPKPEEVKPAETKPVETQPQQTQPQQTTVDAQRDAILAQMKADGAIEGIPDSNFEYGNYTGNAGAGLQWE